MDQNQKRGSFTSSIGFILAAAGSAIGLGNLWRFPYLAAKDGGGVFLLLYIIFALTFGFALMTTEIAIGRKTGLSPLQAYGKMDKRFAFIGILATAVPALIFPYYCVIGGWVTKYTFTYLTFNAERIYADGSADYFTQFITSDITPIVWFLIFMALCAVVVMFGVEKGIEKASKIMMPVLFVLIIGIAVFSLTVSYTDAQTGETRTAIDGLKIYLIPDFTGMTFSRLLSIALDAMGQMFYSMSLAMGIMITYGSYSRKQENLIKSANQIEIFDTAVAVIAGLIMIPTVFAFQGKEGLNTAGPSLMFISLPSIFEQMGTLGTVIGALFFLLVLFAALTSAISLMETVASVLIDRFGMPRPKATVITFAFSVLVGLLVCFGYNILYFDLTLPNGSVGQILDILDYLNNNILMPFVAIATCILVGWITKPKAITDELEIGLNGKRFARKSLYNVMIKYIAPILLVMILLQSFNFFSFLD